MAMNADSSPRFDALVRIWAGAWAWTVGWVLAFLALVLGGLVAVFDIPLQLLTGSQVFDDSAGASKWANDVLNWQIDNNIYALTGRGQFVWWP